MIGFCHYQRDRYCLNIRRFLEFKIIFNIFTNVVGNFKMVFIIPCLLVVKEGRSNVLCPLVLDKFYLLLVD